MQKFDENVFHQYFVFWARFSFLQGFSIELGNIFRIALAIGEPLPTFPSTSKLNYFHNFDAIHQLLDSIFVLEFRKTKSYYNVKVFKIDLQINLLSKSCLLCEFRFPLFAFLGNREVGHVSILECAV